MGAGDLYFEEICITVASIAAGCIQWAWCVENAQREKQKGTEMQTDSGTQRHGSANARRSS